MPSNALAFRVFLVVILFRIPDVIHVTAGLLQPQRVHRAQRVVLAPILFNQQGFKLILINLLAIRVTTKLA